MPSDPILHALPCLMAKPFRFQAARLEAASRQALEELIPKLLQILLHAEPPALLFYQEKRGRASDSGKRNNTESQTFLIKRLCKQL